MQSRRNIERTADRTIGQPNSSAPNNNHVPSGGKLTNTILGSKAISDFRKSRWDPVTFAILMIFLASIFLNIYWIKRELHHLHDDQELQFQNLTHILLDHQKEAELHQIHFLLEHFKEPVVPSVSDRSSDRSSDSSTASASASVEALAAEAPANSLVSAATSASDKSKTSIPLHLLSEEDLHQNPENNHQHTQSSTSSLSSSPSSHDQEQFTTTITEMTTTTGAVFSEDNKAPSDTRRNPSIVRTAAAKFDFATDFHEWTPIDHLECNPVDYENICYSFKLEKLVVHKRFIHDFKYHQLFREKQLVHLMEGKFSRDDPRIRWFPDVTLWPDFTVHQRAAHFWMAVWPLMSIMNLVKKHFSGTHINMLFRKVAFIDQNYELPLWNFVFAQTNTEAFPQSVAPEICPASNKDAPSCSQSEQDRSSQPQITIIDLIKHKNESTNDIYCFEKLIWFPWQYCRIRVRKAEDQAEFKKNIIFMGGTKSFPTTCREVKKPNIMHIVQRKSARKFSNLDEIIGAMIKARGDPVNDETLQTVIPFDSKMTYDVFDDIKLFQDISFLVSVHGGGNANYIFLPKLAHVVEIFPYLFGYNLMYQRLAHDLHIPYFQYFEHDSSIVDEKYPEFRGITEQNCTLIDDCRTNVKRLNVKVTIDGPDGIYNLLTKAVDSWKTLCL